jgi:hypothetical protein
VLGLSSADAADQVMIRNLRDRLDEIERRGLVVLAVGPRLDLVPREHRDAWIPYGDEIDFFTASETAEETLRRFGL